MDPCASTLLPCITSTLLPISLRQFLSKTLYRQGLLICHVQVYQMQVLDENFYYIMFLIVYMFV